MVIQEVGWCHRELSFLHHPGKEVYNADGVLAIGSMGPA